MDKTKYRNFAEAIVDSAMTNDYGPHYLIPSPQVWCWLWDKLGMYPVEMEYRGDPPAPHRHLNPIAMPTRPNDPNLPSITGEHKELAFVDKRDGSVWLACGYNDIWLRMVRG